MTVNEDQTNVMSERILKQAFDNWINPEIERRRKSEGQSEPFQLYMAQIVMNVDSPVSIRLNEEVKAILKVRAARSINKGEPVGMNDFSGIEGVELTELDPNAGYMTLILHNNQWIIAFDFQYNSQRIHEHLQASREFLDTAE